MFAKKQPPSTKVHDHFMFLESVNKRENVYTSGKRCGDSEETCKYHLGQSAESIIEKFVKIGIQYCKIEFN